MSSLSPQRWPRNSNGHTDCSIGSAEYQEWVEGGVLTRMTTEASPAYFRTTASWEVVRAPWAEQNPDNDQY